MRVRKLFVAFAAAVLAVAVAGSSSGFASRAASPSMKLKKPKVTFKIGVVLPFSGNSSFYGTTQGAGVDAAIKEVNAAGGINGHIKVQEITEDNQALPDASVQAMNKLTTVDRVPIVITSFSGPPLAMAPIAAQTKTLLFGSEGNTPALANLSPFFYSSALNATVEVATMGNYLAKTLKAKSVALYMDSGAYGQGSAKLVKATWPSLGLKIVGEVDTDLTATDHSSDIAKLKAMKADYVYVALAGGAPLASFLKQAKELGLDSKIAGQISMDNDAVVSGSGGGADGAVFTSEAYNFNSKRPQMKQFVAVFKRYEHAAPTANEQALYYEGTRILITAIKYVDDHNLALTGNNIRIAIGKIDCFSGLMGPVCFRSDRLANKAVAIKTVRGADRVTLQVIPPAAQKKMKLIK